MLGDNLNPQKSLIIFSDWLNPSSTLRRSRAQSRAFAQQSNRNSLINGSNILEKMINISDEKIQLDFQRKFIYGKQVEIWVRGKIKRAQLFLDPTMPTLIWISQSSQAYLLDLTYTTINRFDLEIEKNSKIKDYIVLHYFQQELPIVFRNESAEKVNEYFNLFSSYIAHINFIHAYPPFFSRIMKLYTMEATKGNVSGSKKAGEVLKLSELIGLTQKYRNRDILQEIVSKDSEQKLRSSTLVTDQQIDKYFKIVHCCEEIKSIYEKYSNSKLQKYSQYLVPHMHRNTFRQFLIFEQRENEASVNEIIWQTQERISFYDFCSYLLSQKSNYVIIPEEIDQNLPLTDYYCYSSHNTYLSGNQLTSDSKIQRYIEDLQGGLKCVQIDVHNDGSKPIITHAVKDKSLCKPIDFQETIQAINKFCDYHPYHYPLIISIQNHASQENRYKMLNILLGIFDKKLLVVNQFDPHQNIISCKTLAQLKGKIIIKTDSNINQIYPYRGTISEKSPIQSPVSPFHIPVNEAPLQFRKPQFQNQYERFRSEFYQFENRMNYFRKNNPKELYLPLAEMTKICGMFKSPSGIHNQESVGYECTSLTNQKANKTDPSQLIRYTKRSWLRIYPLGTQIASSNYNPLPAMRVGAQIIALNTQTKDHYAWLMMSYFTAGRPLVAGAIGYIPKPLYLRSNQSQKIERMISIRIISSNEKVTIKFYGLDEDMKLNLNSAFDFHVKNYLEGFLMFEIGTKFKQCVPLRFIRKGYRVLVAKNELFRDSGIRILVLVTIKDLLTS